MGTGEGEYHVSFYMPEMIDKICYYLKNYELRTKIAQSAYEKTKKHHLNDQI
ncbi:MAG: glycosyltransferase [Clostridia bacterium]|nr:glycosyltransferase [Clostridia bacterium]